MNKGAWWDLRSSVKSKVDAYTSLSEMPDYFWSLHILEVEHGKILDLCVGNCN